MTGAAGTSIDSSGVLFMSESYQTRLHSARSLYRELLAGPLVKQRSRFFAWLEAQNDPPS